METDPTTLLQTIPTSLRDYIEREIVPRYTAFDKAHNLDHVRTVMQDSLELAALYPEANPWMVYTIAAYHDVGLCRDRATHHLVSGELLQADRNLLQWFTPAEITLMKEAVEDHRASADHAPRTLYGCIVAEADRQLDPMTVLLRTVQFGLKHYPQLERQAHYERFVEHLHEKYAEGGYLRIWLPQSKNADRLARLRAIIADEVRLHTIFEQLFRQECGEPRSLSHWNMTNSQM